MGPKDNQIKELQARIIELETENAELRAEIDRLTQAPEPAPEPAPKKTMQVGTSLHRESGETYDQAFARRTKNWGAEPELVRYFYPGLPSGSWPKFGGAQVVVSFKPTNMGAFINGMEDSKFGAFLDTCAKDNEPKRISAWHEEEDDIEKGSITFAQAKQMDAKLKSLVVAANQRNPGANIRIGKVFMQWTLDSRSGRDIDNYLPTEWTFDWLGWDAYPGDSPPSVDYTKVIYTRCKDATAAHGAKNWYICETGTQNHDNKSPDVYDSDQATWITGAVKVADELGCKGWMYFDSTVGGDFRIKGPKGFAAMGGAING